MKKESESEHWYSKTGESAYTIVGSNGKERNTNLRDARKHGYVPSVTTILGVAAKPALENWKINQALNSALTLKKQDDESTDQFFYRCKEHSKSTGKEAAEMGTTIHAMIEQGFAGGAETKPYLAIKKYLDDTFPDETWTAEDSFCADLGYGGKIDLHSDTGIFVDFKTKDNLEAKKKSPSSLVFPEHGMQLSAYAEGCNVKDPERVSIFVDRKDTELIIPWRWSKESHAKHISMFTSLLTYWKLFKNYDPSDA